MKFGDLQIGDLFKPWKDDIIYEKLSRTRSNGNNAKPVYPIEQNMDESYFSDSFHVMFICSKDDESIKKTFDL